jgi:hypothetical protein
MIKQILMANPEKILIAKKFTSSKDLCLRFSDIESSLREKVSIPKSAKTLKTSAIEIANDMEPKKSFGDILAKTNTQDILKIIVKLLTIIIATVLVNKIPLWLLGHHFKVGQLNLQGFWLSVGGVRFVAIFIG